MPSRLSQLRTIPTTVTVHFRTIPLPLPMVVDPHFIPLSSTRVAIHPRELTGFWGVSPSFHKVFMPTDSKYIPICLSTLILILPTSLPDYEISTHASMVVLAVFSPSAPRVRRPEVFLPIPANVTPDTTTHPSQ